MKTKFLAVALAFAASSAWAQGSYTGIDKNNLDTSVRPGNDFYHYAAGGWLATHPLDAEHVSNGSFVDLSDQNELRIQELILQYADGKQPKGTLGQKIGSLYRLMMDSVRLNKEGCSPIKPTLAKIAAIKTRKEYQLVTAQLDRRGESTMMFGIGVGADMRNAGMNLVSVGQGGLGLGTRDYYVNDDAQTVRIRDAYKNYMKNLFKLVGNDEVTAEKKMQAVMAIENRIAKVSYSRVQMRDLDNNYHKMPYTQLVEEFPGIDWGNVFLISGFPAFDLVDVGQPEPIHEVEKILAETSLDNLKAYAEIKVIAGASSQLSDEFRSEAFKLSQVMNGVQQDRLNALGAKITVSAPTVSGYTFLGWYVLNGDKLSDQQDYEYTVLAEGNNLIAVYTPVGGATFRLTVTGSKFTVSGINATQRSYFDRKITANETITVNFTGTEKFLYWINSSNKIVSRSPEYTFMLVQDTDLTAVYSEADTAEALIVFVSAKVDGQVMSSFYATASDPIEFPLVPSSMGKTFKYWSIDGTNEATADVIHNAIASAQDGRIEVYPVYESAGSTYDVTVVCVDENGNEINRETPYSGVAVGSSRTVTAQATLNGKAFSYWTDEAGNILAYTTAYTVRPVESIMLYAVYGIEAEARPTIVMTQAYASMNGTYYRVSFTTSRSVPENYTVQSVGQLYVRAEYLDTTSEDAIKQALTIGSENGNVKNVKSSSTEANDTHTLNVNTSDMNRVFYARGYLVVDGPNGVETIYTDTYLFGSYNTLNDGN